MNAKAKYLPAKIAGQWNTLGDRIPVRTVVTLCAALGIALEWVVLFQQFERQETEAIVAAEVANVNLAQAFDEHVLRIVRDVDLQSRIIAAEIERNGIGRVDLAGFLRTLAADMPFVVQIGATDATDYVVSSSGPASRLYVGDREHVRALRDSDPAALFVGTPVTSRTTGDWWIPMSRRLRARDGGYAGAVMFAVDPQYFSRFYRTVSLGEQGVVTLFRKDGIVLARQPDLIQSIGTDASALSDVKVILAQNAGFRVTKGAFDGVRRVIAFSSLSDYPLKVVVGTPLDDVLAPVRARRPTYYFIAAVITAFILLASFAIVLLYDRSRRSLQALRESETRFRDLTDMSTDWFWEQDAELRFTVVSQGLYPKTELLPESVIGKRRWELPHAGPDEEQWRAHREQSERHEPFSDFVYQRISESGQVHWLSVSGKPLFAEDGTFLGYRGTGRDITRRKHAEEALRQSGREILRLNEQLEQRVAERTAELETAVKEMETFTYMVAHDLRSPLRAMNGYAHILIEHYGKSMRDADRGYLERIAGNAWRMEQLIADLLAFSRFSHQPIRNQTLDMQQLARSVIAEKIPAGFPAQVKLLDLPPCMGDPALIRVVLENLIGNAAKFSRGAASPFIEIGHADGAFFVRDNGAGFDMAYAGKLFEPFTRLHRLEDFEGTGMGLAIARRIVERHGGRIWASAKTGKGASFFFVLG